VLEDGVDEAGLGAEVVGELAFAGPVEDLVDARSVDAVESALASQTMAVPSSAYRRRCEQEAS
jgi:hypothetical protein